MNAPPVAASLAQRIAARRGVVARGIRSRITWSSLFRATSYARSALWIVPLVAIGLVLLVAPALRALDAWLDWRFTGLDVEGARALFQTVITLALSFLVFIFGSLLVAIQVAGGQLTPRIIATTLLRDNVVRYTVGLFVFTLMLSVMSLNRLQGHVYQLLVAANALLGIACLMDFLFFIDYTARLLRPVSICTRLGGSGLEVIDAVYPDPLGDAGEEPAHISRLGLPGREYLHEGASEVILAVDVRALVAEARRSAGVIEVVPRVGDFLASGEALFRLHAGAVRVDDRRLAAAVALGPERTLEQDPMFAFRILVDIALKALSPAINDPTTAVLAIDQVHRLLRVVGNRRLRGDAVRDEAGEVRVVLRTPDWGDYVHIACREIRACGAGSVQVARRMGAMLEDLLRLLPGARRGELLEERALLDRALVQLYSYPEDLALARIPDIQGLGGGASARDQNTILA
jgi:uncharacterized membrane protein